MPRIELLEVIQLGWGAGASLLPLIAGINDTAHVPTHLAVKIVGPRFEIDGVPVSTDDLPIQRWVTMEPPDDETLASIEPELNRIARKEVFEH